MRALCGAIIAAGALIGLGLSAIGIGYRYGQVIHPERPLKLSEVDHPLIWVLVFLSAVAFIGLGLAIVGLAYHHHRRHHEFLREYGGTTSPRVAG
jgi:hypothetical protein